MGCDDDAGCDADDPCGFWEDVAPDELFVKTGFGFTFVGALFGWAHWAFGFAFWVLFGWALWVLGLALWVLFDLGGVVSLLIPSAPLCPAGSLVLSS